MALALQERRDVSVSESRERCLITPKAAKAGQYHLYTVQLLSILSLETVVHSDKKLIFGWKKKINEGYVTLLA